LDVRDVLLLPVGRFDRKLPPRFRKMLFPLDVPRCLGFPPMIPDIFRDLTPIWFGFGVFSSVDPDLLVAFFAYSCMLQALGRSPQNAVHECKFVSSLFSHRAPRRNPVRKASRMYEADESGATAI
jgi:hypothetical protein